ncbi:virulence-associated E family protein [Spirosoma sp. RP8]|uniref:Virulence-associated E family protein n=1 Tax=Spirosoma liriopis TaxID=2937440 RepID=A0ABT0HLV5_9BACT|nr:virulence-associated E family protein [Spirosoma liriopis]MCK8493156.1 virulence-associated E family protein [Spirosoma liriopis]
MDSNNNSKQKAESKPIIYRIQHYLFAEYEYRINIVSNQLERKGKTATEWELVNMADIELELFEYGLNNFKQPLQALFGSKHIPKYDPFITYFDSLPIWNKSQPDHIDQLADFVQTDDQIWWKPMFKKWLVRAVGQAIGRIPFNKQCLTLVGKQNDGKTTFLDFLIPDGLKGYSKKGFDFGHKDGKFSLIQNFFINLDELASFDKKELNNEFKTVLSESTVKFRLLFQNIETPSPRRASFVASTNQFEFLTDETGNVRWLPFVVKHIQHDAGGPEGYAAIVDIDRVWAQGLALLNGSCFNCNMTQDEVNHQEVLNRRFLRTTTEMEVIRKHYLPSEKGDSEAVFCTASDIEEYLRTKTSLRLHRAQIGRAMQVMGFAQETNYNSKKGYTVKGYFIKFK